MMAEKVDPSQLLVKCRRGKYDWDLWMNGDTWKCVREVDYTCGDAAFRSSMQRPAEIRGLTVTAIVRDGYVVFRAEKK